MEILLLLVLIISFYLWRYFSSNRSADTDSNHNDEISDKTYDLYGYFVEEITTKTRSLGDEIYTQKNKKNYKKLYDLYPKYLDFFTEEENFLARNPQLLSLVERLNNFAIFERYLYFAEILMQLGKYNEAIEWVHKMRLTGPENREKLVSTLGSNDWLRNQRDAHIMLKRIYAHMKDHEEAILHGLISVAIRRVISSFDEMGLTPLQLSNSVFDVGGKYLLALGLAKKDIKTHRENLNLWLQKLNVDSLEAAVHEAQSYHSELFIKA